MLFLLTSVLFKISKEITKHTVHFNFIINEEIIEVKFQIAFSLIRQIKNFILISKLLKYITCIYLKLFIVINNKTSCACWIINEIRETDSWFYTIYFFCFTLNSTYSTLKKVYVGHTELIKPSVRLNSFELNDLSGGNFIRSMKRTARPDGNIPMFYNITIENNN